MNKRLYRIVFNRARGMFQVAAEIVRRQGQSGSRGHRGNTPAGGTATATCTRLQFALWLALGQVTVASLAQAQIVADPTAPGNQRPTVLEAANGVPLVNIQTPSAAGVSRNTYQQFDVNTPGAILNNARTSAQTQIGGWVQGNPWLAGGSARVILNEVNSSNPSQLRGMVEVAGQRAEVVIANPAGITCDGCGFINADRTTLTTGALVMNGGSLEGYRVQGGAITINGKGMDARGSDYTAIIARAVQINAALWAQHLQVNAGAQEVSADHATVKPIATNSKPPEFSLDVSALGGMYAGKIKLIGTEHGVGVRNAGHIGAAVGEVIVTADGRLENAGTLQAKTDTQIAAQSVTNTDGVLYTGRNLEIKAAESVENQGGAMLAGGTATITAQHVDNRAAKTADQPQGIQAERIRITAQGLVRNDGLIDSTKTQIQADTVDNVGTGRIYGNHVAIAAQTVHNREEGKKAAVIAARERLDVGADTVINREHALIFSAGTGHDALSMGGALDANQQTTGAATLVRNDSATIESLGGLTINSQSLFNTNQHIETILAQFTDPTRYLYIQPKGDPVKHRSDEYRWESWSRAGRYRNKQTGQAIEDWTQFNVIETEYETQVVASDPALIRAGKDITLRGENLTNDKSQIITGGALQGDLDSLNNIDALGEHRIHQEGTSQYTRSRWRGGLKRYHERRWDAVLAYTPADEVRTITVNVVKAEQYAAGNASSTPTLDTDGTYHVPANSLYRVNPTAPGYLIETDPRFTNYRQWLSSDYMFDQLRIDPTLVHKRLGDGFYEQQLVRDQIGQLTGRRFLDSYADDEAQYRALLESGITVARAWNLRPGIALSVEQMAQLTSDIVWLVERQVTLPDGTTTVALVPQVYVRPRAGDLDGRGTLLAADRVELNLTGDLSNGGTIAGRTVVRLTGENLHNLGGRITGDGVALAARSDINNTGGTIAANSALSLAAGRDLNITSTTHSDAKQAGLSDFSRTNMDRVAGLYVTGGTLTATAGRDTNLNAAHIVNSDPQGQTVITAGRDLNLTTVQIAEQERNVRNANNYLRQGTVQDVGTSLQTAGDVLLQAGGNLSATAATVHSQDGAIVAHAAGDITLAAGQITSNWSEGRQHKDRSTLGSKQTTTRDSLNQTQAIASTLSGNTVVVQGQNITVSGSNVVSDAGTVLSAQDNLTIQSATETRAETHFKQVKQSGVLYNGGAAVTFGSQMQSLDRQGNSTSAAASTVGSTQGDISLTAGNTYQQFGSHIKAPEGGIGIDAKTVNIVEAREASHSAQEYKFRQSGLTVALSSTVLSAIQTGQQMASAASHTDDARMQALAGATTAMAAMNAYEAVKASPSAAGGINISVTVGSSRSRSTSTMTRDAVAGSTVTAGGDIRIRATGAPDSAITVRGSDIYAGGNATLTADGDINLLAAQNTTDLHRQSSGSSSGAGLAVSLGQNGMAFGVTANASRSKGKGDGRDVWWTNTHVAAGEQLTLQSGADTTLRGAVASGHKVAADVGGHLNLESLQDTSVFHSQDKSIGGSVTVGYGFAAGSASYGKTKVDGDFASVVEQSGIQAGDGGFQIWVGGNTDLRGAVIASTEPAVQNGRNHLSTATLTATDLENRSEYTASSASVSAGFSVASASKAANDDKNKPAEKSAEPLANNVAGKGSDWGWQNFSGGVSASAAGRSRESGSVTSVTRSGVSSGTVDIRDADAQVSLTGKSSAATLASLNRDVLTGDSANGISKNWDPEKLANKMKAQAEIAAAFTQQAYARVDQYVQAERIELRKRESQAKTPEEKAAIASELKDLELQERIMNVLIGAATGAGASAVTKETLSAAASKMRDLMIEDSKKFPGIVDTDGHVLSNISGISIGVRLDGVKIGGTRIDLDVLCGKANTQCKTNSDGSLYRNEDNMVVFDNAKAGMNMLELLKTDEGEKALGSTGGIQGALGTLFGLVYLPGGA